LFFGLNNSSWAGAFCQAEIKPPLKSSKSMHHWGIEGSAWGAEASLSFRFIGKVIANYIIKLCRVLNLQQELNKVIC